MDTGEHITKEHRQSCWTMEKAVMCRRRWKISFWTSARLGRLCSKPSIIHNLPF